MIIRPELLRAAEGGGPSSLPPIQPRPALVFSWGPGALIQPVVAQLVIPSYIVAYFSAVAGTGGNATAAATGSAVFSVSYVRSGITTAIGNVTWGAGSKVPTMPGVIVALQPGDIVIATSPNPPDGTLADPMFTVAAIQTQ